MRDLKAQTDESMRDIVKGWDERFLKASDKMVEARRLFPEIMLQHLHNPKISLPHTIGLAAKILTILCNRDINITGLKIDFSIYTDKSTDNISLDVNFVEGKTAINMGKQDLYTLMQQKQAGDK